MGISIYGIGLRKDFACSYTTFNDLRRLACKIDGYCGPLEILLGDGDFLQSTNYPQLMHLSDNRCMLVPKEYLDDIVNDLNFRTF